MVNVVVTRKIWIVENLLKGLENLIFPKKCLNCGDAGSYLCFFCADKVEYVEEPTCIICGGISMGGFTHYSCQTKYTPNRLVSAFKYKGVIRKALKMAKYKTKVFSIYNDLVNLAVEHFNEINLQIGEEAIVVPVPIHWKKFVSRTFNHSEVIANLFAQKYGINVVHALKKTKNTPSQSLLNRKERIKNVRGSFLVKRKAIDKISGKDVIIIDDICTTGATLLSASKTLRELGKRGPRYIYCITLAYDYPKDLTR